MLSVKNVIVILSKRIERENLIREQPRSEILRFAQNDSGWVSTHPTAYSPLVAMK
jgi:hypothetical protein